MNISEFAEERGRKTGTVSKYIREHPKEFEGHVTQAGKSIILDEIAVSILDAKYPMPKPVTIIGGIPKEEHYHVVQEKDREIQKLQQQLIALQNESSKMQYRLGQLELLEDLTQQKDEQLQAKQQELNEASIALKEKEAEIERLKNRSLWQRIRNI